MNDRNTDTYKMRDKLKKRTAHKISQRKLVAMVNLFEQLIDEEIEIINISESKITTKNGNKYFVDIQRNEVEDIKYSDAIWDE